MEFGKKQRTVSNLISPEPRPLKIKVSAERPNPFLDKFPVSLGIQEEKAANDLRKILEANDSPKKPSNRHKAPIRQQVNPMIFDEKFQELDSSASTTEDSMF
jgi:hypothetical protein